jgi:hypothetical protein
VHEAFELGLLLQVRAVIRPEEFQGCAYRARFLSGLLQNIVRVNEDNADRVRYGLASFRWFHAPSFLFDDSDEYSDASKADVRPEK